MPYKHVRFKKPDVVRKGGMPVVHDIWARFTFVRLNPVLGDPLTRVLLCDDSGASLEAPFIFMIPYPLIVQTTREIGSYDVCSTFDVDFSAAWPDDRIAARDPITGALVELPRDAIDEAAFHLHEKQPVAV